MKLAVVFSLLLLALTFVSAIEDIPSLGEFPQGTEVSLIQTCSCDNVTFTSIKSVEDGLNLNLLNESKLAEKTNSNTFNLTLNNTFFADVGDYYVTGFGFIDEQTQDFIYQLRIIPADDALFNIDFGNWVVVVFFIIFLAIVGALTFFKYFLFSGGLLFLSGFILFNLHWLFGVFFVVIGLVVVSFERGKK